MASFLIETTQSKTFSFCRITSFLFPFFLLSCAALQNEKIAPQIVINHNRPNLKSVGRVPGSSPTPASYYHTILGLQYEKERFFGSPLESDRLALKEYISALEHDPQSAFLMERIAALYHRMGNQEDALFYAERASRLSPANIEALILLGDIHLASGKTEEGFNAYRKSIQLAPNQRNAYFKIAKIYADKKDFDMAEKMIYKGIEVGPPSPFPYYFLGSLSTEKNRLTQGLEFHQEALSLNPNFEPAHIGIAVIYERQGKIQSAINVYRHILNRINPKSRQAANRLLQLFMKNKSFDDALSLLERLFEENPTNTDLSFQMVQVLVEKKEFSEAIEQLSPLVAARQNDLRLQVYLAALFEENHEPDKAISTYQAVLEKNPNAYDVRIRLGSLYFYQLKDVSRALAQGELAKKIAPQRTEAYLFSGLVLHEAERYDDAAKTLLKGIEKNPTLPDLHFHLGATFDKLKRFDDMVTEMKKAIDLDADYANALNYLGYTFADNGIRLNEAVTMINRALKVRPDDGYFIDSLGWAYYKKGEAKNALRLLKKAASLVPNDPVIHEHLGEVYLKNGRVELAREAWARSISLDPENDTLILRFKQAGFGHPSLENPIRKLKVPPLDLH